MVVNILANEVVIRVVAPCPTRQLTHTLGSSDLSSMLLVEMMNGTDV